MHATWASEGPRGFERAYGSPPLVARFGVRVAKRAIRSGSIRHVRTRRMMITRVHYREDKRGTWSTPEKRRRTKNTEGDFSWKNGRGKQQKDHRRFCCTYIFQGRESAESELNETQRERPSANWRRWEKELRSYVLMFLWYTKKTCVS